MLPLWLLLPGLAWGQVRFSGTVTLSGTGDPIPGAEVALVESGQLTFTNQAGAFRLDQVPAGRYTLRISAQGYLTLVDAIRVTDYNITTNYALTPTKTVTEEVLITATRASERTATTYSALSEEQIDKQNFGQDLPFLLDQMPSTVITSDAGAGVGYTGLRIRGTDPTRTNVTINGVPLNDPESHGLFWVNLPDLSSSVDNIQVQRGVGTSTNGAAAFGASINIQTDGLTHQPYTEVANSYGSFNTRKHTLNVGTGLIKERFALDARLSRIASDGWVDRATSDLKSYFISGGYYGKRSLLKLLHFAGQEETYQSWWGVPEALALGDAAGLEAHIARNFYTDAEIENLRRSGRQYNYYTYDKEVDNYRQDHYQLHYALNPLPGLNVNTALHYTRGRGYFEQYRPQDELADYGLPAAVVGGDTLETADIIRRRWLDNDFYGLTYALSYAPGQSWDLTLGGAWNRYDGDHFGTIIWAETILPDLDIRDRYYESRGLKTDFTTYLKGSYNLSPQLVAYGDLQIRQIDYQIGNMALSGPGRDNDQQAIEGVYTYTFFNPKAGLTWTPNPHHQAYASFSVANREPVRSDFIDAPAGRIPQHETLHNWEAGYRLSQNRFALYANTYFMQYDNQLVLNGELNDVGASVRQNVADSYRLGVELQGGIELLPSLRLQANLALSQNRIAEFEEILYDYGTGAVITEVYTNTPIAFSPAVIAGGSLSYQPVTGLDISLISKYVGRQYLDNTGRESRSLAPFWRNDLRLLYSLEPIWAQEISLGLQVNNLLDIQYAPNGYTYSYLFNG
ncbi:MAG: TonB-dependent receptor, partial [Bacteroidetes bacterium]